MIKILVFVDESDNRVEGIIKLVRNNIKINKEIVFIYVFKPEDIPFFLENINLIICNKVTDNIMSLNKKIIVCARNDSTPTSSNRKFLLNENVISYFKDYTFKNVKLFKNYYLYNRYHFNLLEDLYKITPKDLIEKYNRENQLSDMHINKIKCVTWNVYQYSNVVHHFMTQLTNSEINYLNKDIDIFMICHNHSEHALLEKHRIMGKKIVNEISKKNNLICCTESVEPREYLDKLKKSKICVAPYGLGERIALDQYGILAGCIVIKPPMDFLECDPNIYEKNFFEFCKLDFSNLESIITNIINNYKKYLQIAIERRKNLIKYDEDYYSTQFYNNIKDLII